MIDLRDALRLYLVADPDQCAGAFLPSVEAAIHGGVTAIQLRAKHRTDREIVALAREIRELTSSKGIAFLMNDRIDIALATGADGAHLGVHDLAPSDARKITPTDFIIGYSPDTPDDVAGDAADYLGIGPVYGTTSKNDAGAALGLDEFAERVQSILQPVVGIGGISVDNARAVLDAGACGVAVISSILGDPDPKSAARNLHHALSRGS